MFFKANFEDLNRLNWVEDISALVQLKTERNHLELGILIICPLLHRGQTHDIAHAQGHVASLPKTSSRTVRLMIINKDIFWGHVQDLFGDFLESTFPSKKMFALW